MKKTPKLMCAVYPTKFEFHVKMLTILCISFSSTSILTLDWKNLACKVFNFNRILIHFKGATKKALTVTPQGHALMPWTLWPRRGCSTMGCCAPVLRIRGRSLTTLSKFLSIIDHLPPPVDIDYWRRNSFTVIRKNMHNVDISSAYQLSTLICQRS